MKKCTELTEFISAYADGELASSDKRQVEEHLESCESCSAILSIYREISIATDESSVDAPDALRIGVMKRIQNEEINRADDGKEQRNRLHFILTRYIPVAACLAVGLLLWQFWGVFQNNQIGFMAPNAEPQSAPLYITDEETAIVYDMAVPTGEPVADSLDYDNAEQPEAGGFGADDGSGDQAMNIPTGPDWDLTVPGGPRTVHEAEELVEMLNMASASIVIVGELPAFLAGYEPEAFSAWLGWDMVFMIPGELVSVLIDEAAIGSESISRRTDMLRYADDTTYAVVFFSSDG